MFYLLHQKPMFFIFLPRSYQIFWYYDKISKNNSQNRIFSKIRFLYMWVEIWHFQMIFKLVFVSWNIVGIISLHSFLKISIAYDSRYHATAILIARMSWSATCINEAGVDVIWTALILRYIVQNNPGVVIWNREGCHDTVIEEVLRCQPYVYD